jgi:hypothetical protein
MMLHRARLITAGRPLLQPHTSPQAPGEATRASLMLIPAFGVLSAITQQCLTISHIHHEGSPWLSLISGLSLGYESL